tara:strand:- start:1387 stop:1773 length:387 start_codon:yes stop_codon:yes gene_type:complete
MLRQLYEQIQESPLTSYKLRGTFTTPKSGERIEETTLDLILINLSEQGIIQIGAFPDHTRVGYMGTSEEIQRRIRSLRLPKTPNNLGNTVFHQLQRLAEQKFGLTYVEQRIEPGYEGQLERNLKKLVS